MANIDIQEAQAWSEKTKLDLGTALDGELEASISSQVISTIAQVYDVSSWVDSSTTPRLVRSIIAMDYVAWWYDRQYSEDAGGGSSYGALLRSRADMLVAGILAGTISLVDVVPVTDVGQPAFYPNDISSADVPTHDDESLGDSKFSMGTIW